MNYLYHGSKNSNLLELKPFKSGHNNNYVYAVSHQAFAVIFINRPGGSLLASWGRLENGKVFFCERKKGIFDAYYNKQSGSLYFVNKKYFFKQKELWKEEWVSNKKVPIIKEIKIIDLKKYLQNLEKTGQFKIILHENRLKFFPNFDEELINSMTQLIQKYGTNKILPFIQKHYPDLIDEVLYKIKKSK